MGDAAVSAAAPRLLRWLALAALLLSGGLSLSLIYWPGIITSDSEQQYAEALTGNFDDWHPPMMNWVWRGLGHIASGPAPMLVLQLLLYGAGIAGLALWAWRRGRPGLAAALCATTMLPLPAALMGEVLKDSLMAGALTAAASLALLATADDGEGRRGLRIAAALLTVFAATLRFNAFPAGVPILLLVGGAHGKSSWWRLALGAVLSTAILVGAMPVANRALGAGRSDVELSLVIFDLAGITRRTGQDMFPPLPAAHPAKIISRCYFPVEWDSYSWWAEPLCPISFAAIDESFHAHKIAPYGYLVRQIVAHPLAYAGHRLTHWNIATRFLVRGPVDRPVQRQSVANPWGFAVTQGPALDALDRLDVALGVWPPGWPCCYIGLAAGLLLASASLPSRLAIRMLAGSGLLYALAYAVFSVASELRYYLWTMIATALAAAITISDLAALPLHARRRAGLAALLPFAIVTITAMAWRI